MISTALVLLPLLLASAQDEAGSPAPSPPPTEGIEVTYLGDEAFLLRSATKTVLVDAFLGPAPALAPIPEATRTALRDGEGLFQKVRLSIATHEHGHGYRFAEAAKFLRDAYTKQGQPVIFEAPPKLGSRLKAEVGFDFPGATMITRRWKTVGSGNSLALRGLRVDYLTLPHVGDDDGEIEQLGFVLRHAGLRILFAAHGDLRMENLEPYQAVIANVDVALVPYAQLLDDEQRNLLRNRVAPRHVIATGIPVEKAGEIAAKLEAVFPGAIVLTKPLESHLFVPPPKNGGR